MSSTDALAGSVQPGQRPPVAIMVPALNESAYIVACLESLLGQQGCDVVDVIVADGGSTDDTVALVLALAARHPVIHLLHNPGRIQSAGLNLAARAADPAATVLIRADAHTVYPSGFVAECVGALIANSATSVVVPMRTVGRAGFQRAVAAAQNSRLGNGGAAHRIVPQSRFVDHGHHAAFDRAFFTRIGGYNEGFSHNEDAEFDVRARRAGGKIWMCASAIIDYYPRTSAVALCKQYLNFGRGRARTILTHRMKPAPRQLLPVLLLPALITCLVLSPSQPIFGLIPLAYAMACLSAGALFAVKRGDPWLLAAGPAAMIMHLSFAAGFLGFILANGLMPASDLPAKQA